MVACGLLLGACWAQTHQAIRLEKAIRYELVVTSLQESKVSQVEMPLAQIQAGFLAKQGILGLEALEAPKGDRLKLLLLTETEMPQTDVAEICKALGLRLVSMHPILEKQN